jgi:PAS domain S-box-containing protein
MAICYLNPNRLVGWANQTFALLIGVPLEQTVGRRAEDLLPGWSDHIVSLFDRAHDTGESWQGSANDFLRGRVEHESNHWSGSISVVRTPHGDFEGWLLAITDITDTVRAERRQAKAVERERSAAVAAEASQKAVELNAVYAAIADGVIVYGEMGRALYANQAVVSTYGFDPVGLQRDEIARRLSIRHLDGTPAKLEDLTSTGALRGETVQGVPFRLKGIDGREFVVRATAAPLVVDGHVRGAVAVWHDLTENTRAQQALQERERALHTLFEDTLNPILVSSSEGKYIDANDTALRFLQVSREELLGRNVWDFVPPETLERHRREHSPFVAKRTVETEYLVDGEVKTLLLNVVPVETGAGTVLYGIGQDITARKRAEEALKRESEVNAALAQLARALIGVSSPDEISSLVLSHAMRITGSTLGFVGYIDPRRMRLFISAMVGSDEEREARGPDVFETKSETGMWALRNRQPFFTNAAEEDPRVAGLPAGHRSVHRILAAPALLGDEVVGQVALANSEHDYAERDLSLVERLADLYAIAIQTVRLRRLRDEFLSLAAHELMTPLTSLSGFAQLLSRQGGHDEGERRAFRAMLAQGERVSRLVRLTLDAVQLQAGELCFYQERFNLGTVAGEAAAAIRQTTERHEIQVQVEEAVVVVADRDRIRSVLAHLLENAVKYSPDGGSITLSVAKRDDRALVAVRDRGIGIPADKQSSVFEPFYQSAPMVHPTTGMGLGLYVSREVLRRLGGDLWVESSPGQGSTFWFALPLAG